MTPEEFKAARLQLGWSQDQFADMLGYTGPHRRQQIEQMETGFKPIREAQKLLVEAYLDGWRPKDFVEDKRSGRLVRSWFDD